MEMTGEQLVPASQEETWKALNDPEVLKACVPGCESIERISGDDFLVLMVARVGPVSAKFKGKLSLSDIKPPNSYSISFEGQGGAAGFAKGSARVSLSPENSSTRLSYEVKANVGGKLAQIGSRLVDGAARKVADDFFRNFNEKLSAAKPGGHTGEDHAEAVPRDPDLPSVSDSTLGFVAAGSLVIYLVSMLVLFD
jgi:carbon monoxide dehydrogenase subunit G